MDAFFAALEAGHYDQVDDAFRTGQLRPNTASTLLQRSVSNSWTEAVGLLLRHGVRPTSISVQQLSKCHSLEVFKLLAQYQWPFKQEGHLIVPNMFEHREILDWLLDQGVELNWYQSLLRYDLKKGEYDNTVAVLNQAAAAGKTDIFDYLVSRGADPSRCLALHYTVLYQPEDSTKVSAVIDHFVDKYQFDVNEYGTRGGLVKLSDFTENSDQNGPPLKAAVRHQNIPAVKALLSRGADAGPALGTAFDGQDMEALRLLLEAGGDATKACIIAATRSNLQATKICLEFGADPGPALKQDAEFAAGERSYKPMSNAVKKVLKQSK